jgi:hypothetical protein
MLGRIVFWLVVAWLVIWAINHQAEVTGWIHAFTSSAQR